MHLPDELQHIQQHLYSKYAKFKKGVIVLSIVAAVLLVVTIVLMATNLTDNKSQTLISENSVIQAENAQLKESNQKLNAQVSSLDLQNGAMQKNITQLQTSTNTTNEKIAQLQSIISKNCDINHQQLRFNQSNIKGLILSIQNPSNDVNNGPVPALQFLNLSGNSLIRFCDNSLPDLISLDLTGNRIASMSYNKFNKLEQLIINQEPSFYLRQFSKNVIPLLTQLNLRKTGLYHFEDNVLPAIKTLNLEYNDLTNISGWTYSNLQTLLIADNQISSITFNNFPLLRDLPDVYRINTITDNYFGKIDTIRLRSNWKSQILKFQRNKLPAITAVFIYNSTFDFTNFRTNLMPQLRNLTIINCSLSNFAYQEQFRLLTSISLQSNSNLTKFSNHEYPNLSNLSIRNNRLIEFSGNKLPNLQSLIISQQVQNEFCNDNLMVNLKNLTMWSNKNYNCLFKFQALQTMSLHINDIVFDDHRFPLLQNLSIRSIRSFKNNDLPMLKILNLYIPDEFVFIDLRPYQATLESLVVQGLLLSLDRINFTRLRQLTFTRNEQTPITFMSCAFPQLQTLKIDGVYTNSIPLNTYGSLRSIRLDYSTPFYIDYNANPNLESIQIGFVSLDKFNDYSIPNLQSITIFASNLTQFSGNQLPMVDHIYLSANNLVSIDCRGFPGVKVLFLDRNLLKDNIADILIACNFTQLQYLQLEDNTIQNSAEVSRKLGGKYSNATIKI